MSRHTRLSRFSPLSRFLPANPSRLLTNPTVRRGAEAVLDVVRRGRYISWVPDGMDLGNLLTIGRWAYQGAEAGEDRFVLLRPHREAVLSMFPVLRQRLFVPLAQVRFTDRRLITWRGGWRPSDALYVNPDYIRTYLLPGSGLTHPPLDLSDTVVINVRRGMYYIRPDLRQSFGFNVTEYVATAVDATVHRSGLPRRFHVVSDDIPWCREHLPRVLPSKAEVSWGSGPDSRSDLATLAGAHRLILAISTFSYWGGFIGDELHPGREVWVPWFLCRDLDGGDSARDIAPHWNVVRDIPGGWGPPPPD